MEEGEKALEAAARAIIKDSSNRDSMETDIHSQIGDTDEDTTQLLMTKGHPEMSPPTPEANTEAGADRDDSDSVSASTALAGLSMECPLNLLAITPHLTPSLSTTVTGHAPDAMAAGGSSRFDDGLSSSPASMDIPSGETHMSMCTSVYILPGLTAVQQVKTLHLTAARPSLFNQTAVEC